VRAQPEAEGRGAVWHLHGRLMHRANGRNWRAPGRLVLAEGDYVRSTYATFPQTWVADCLANTLCIFVGLSMTDPNFIRWLYSQPDADRPHPRFAIFVRQGSPVADDAVRKMLEHATAERWRLSGVTPVWTNYYGEVAQLLHEVGLRIGDPDHDEFATRAATRLATARKTVMPDDRHAFLETQRFLSSLLRESLLDVRQVAADDAVDLSAHQLGLGLWGVDHRTGSVELWAVTHRILQEREAVERRPMHFDSRWIAVAAVIGGAPVEQDPAVYTSRWRFVRGIPVTVAPNRARSVAGALTLTSTVPLAENALSRHRAPAGLLRIIDRLLVEAAVGLFE
jgi:hypothetical protein